MLRQRPIGITDGMYRAATTHRHRRRHVPSGNDPSASPTACTERQRPIGIADCMSRAAAIHRVRPNQDGWNLTRIHTCPLLFFDFIFILSQHHRCMQYRYAIICKNVCTLVCVCISEHACFMRERVQQMHTYTLKASLMVGMARCAELASVWTSTFSALQAGPYIYIHTFCYATYMDIHSLITRTGLCI